MKTRESERDLLQDLNHIHQNAATTEDGQRCMVAPSPELREKIKTELSSLSARSRSFPGAFLRFRQPTAPGLNDGTVKPPEALLLAPTAGIRAKAKPDRAPLSGTLRVIVVLVDFTDKPMGRSKADFEKLFFSLGQVPTGSVREYYREVSGGKVDIQGEVVGPFRMPRTLQAYANGAAGTGPAAPNARTMAVDAAKKADASVNFAQYDNDGDGFVDAYIVIHAGAGGEQTGDPNDIWSHKWVVDGAGPLTTDGKKIYAYLTVPEDCKIGVCCHEIGHLLFAWPDLYDTDSSSEGVGNWCLMGGGSWNGGGDVPAHPSAWCKATQKWVKVRNILVNGKQPVTDVKTSMEVLRLWSAGVRSTEYFLLENRQKTGYDRELPGSGLLLWHIDDNVPTNENESHPKVALLQADGQNHLQTGVNRGDDGDPYPGSARVTKVNGTTVPNTRAYSGSLTKVEVSAIPRPAPTVRVNIKVR